MERGVDFDFGENSQFEEISNVIAVLGWRKFAIEPATIESVVREFYANVPDIIDNVVHVWWVLVLFRMVDINGNYNLMNVGEVEYGTYLENVDYATVI